MFGAFTVCGWQRLDNRALTLKIRNNLTINFAGTHDAHMQADAWPGFIDTGPAAGVNIAVTHAPYRRVLDTAVADGADLIFAGHTHGGDRKSTRLNSSHVAISYAVFCLKKKNK